MVKYLTPLWPGCHWVYRRRSPPELADLYDNSEEGIVSEADYLKLRNEKKAELAEIDIRNKRGVKW